MVIASFHQYTAEIYDTHVKLFTFLVALQNFSHKMKETAD